MYGILFICAIPVIIAVYALRTIAMAINYLARAIRKHKKGSIIIGAIVLASAILFFILYFFIL